MKNILLLIILLASNMAMSAEFYVLDRNNSHLYLSDSEQIKDMNTITYVVDIKEPDVLIAHPFYLFSDEIGLKNGAVMLTPNDSDAFRYISQSNCDISYDGVMTVIFENKLSGNCDRFHIVDSFEFAKTLGELHRYIDKNKNVDKAKLRNDLKTVIHDLFKGFDSNVPISVQEFANRIIDYLPN